VNNPGETERQVLRAREVLMAPSSSASSAEPRRDASWIRPDTFRALISRIRVSVALSYGRSLLLYTSSSRPVVDGAVADRQDVAFGIREFHVFADGRARRLFKVNGKPVLIRGGGWPGHDSGARIPRASPAEIRPTLRRMKISTPCASR